MPITADQIASVTASDANRTAHENRVLINMLIRAQISGDDSELIAHCKAEADKKETERKEWRAYEKEMEGFLGKNWRIMV